MSILYSLVRSFVTYVRTFVSFIYMYIYINIHIDMFFSDYVLLVVFLYFILYVFCRFVHHRNAFSANSWLWCALYLLLQHLVVFNCYVDVMQTNTNFVVIKAKLVIIRWCDEWHRFFVARMLNRDRWDWFLRWIDGMEQHRTKIYI